MQQQNKISVEIETIGYYGMTSASYEKSAVVSGIQGEGVMTSGSYEESVMASDSYGEGGDAMSCSYGEGFNCMFRLFWVWYHDVR